jgi:hypothetical protein
MVTLFSIPGLDIAVGRLSLYAAEFHNLRKSGQGGNQISQQQLSLAKTMLEDTFSYCEKVGFENASEKALSLLTCLEQFPDHYDVSGMAIELNNMHHAIIKDIFDFKFVLVLPEVAKYLDSDSPLGVGVATAFPSSSTDLIEAGNCLALGCHAAMVYHLMRATEIGVWELGRDRQIPLAKSGKIEFHQWGAIIGELEIAVEAIQQWPNSASKEDAHKFYNGLLVEIRAFNDGWRRHSAHPRPHMPVIEQDEALALWGHVARFFTKLSSKINEKQHTPLVWS